MRNLFIGIVLASLFYGCAGFAYRYYGLDLATECYENGKLLGPQPKDDLPFTECKPNDFVKGKCIVMKSDEFYAFKGDYSRVTIELKECQKNCK